MKYTDPSGRVFTANRAPVTEFRLSDRWCGVLALRPETGMGYQVATVFLRGGREFRDVIIPDVLILSDGTLLSDRKFVEADILGLAVHSGARCKL